MFFWLDRLCPGPRAAPSRAVLVDTLLDQTSLYYALDNVAYRVPVVGGESTPVSGGQAVAVDPSTGHLVILRRGYLQRWSGCPLRVEQKRRLPSTATGASMVWEEGET
jgi:hypothetical protein